MGRWCVYIDLEGFGNLYDKEDQVLLSLGDLMEGIFQIGCRCFPETPERLFAHQLGDGFVIVSEFSENTLDRPIAIALALLRHVAQSGQFAKASVSEGEFADIRSCYPARVLEASTNDRTIRLGRGVMTLFPVMGTALIRAFSVLKSCPSGPLLTAASAERQRLPSGLITREVPERDLIVVDWVNSQNELASWIANKAGLKSPSSAMMSDLLNTYCQKHNVKDCWSESVNNFLGVAIERGR